MSRWRAGARRSARAGLEPKTEQRPRRAPAGSEFAARRRLAFVVLVGLVGFVVGAVAEGRPYQRLRRADGTYPSYATERMIRLAEGTATLGDLYGGPQGAPGSTGAPDGWRSFDTPPMAAIQDERGKQVGAQQAAPQRDVPGEAPVRRASRQEFLLAALRWDFREAQIMVQGYLDGNPAASDADTYKHCLQHARAGRHWNQSDVPSNLSDALDADPTRAPDGSRARRLQDALGKDSEAAVWVARAALRLNSGLSLTLVYDAAIAMAQVSRNWRSRGADLRVEDLVACAEVESSWDPTCQTGAYKGLLQVPGIMLPVDANIAEACEEIGSYLMHHDRTWAYSAFNGGPGNRQLGYASKLLGLSGRLIAVLGPSPQGGGK